MSGVVEIGRPGQGDSKLTRAHYVGTLGVLRKTREIGQEVMSEYTENVAALAVATAAGVPVVLWGAPGTGKTSVIESIAATNDWACETVIASVREPSDFVGLPVVDNGSVSLAPPAWAKRICDAGGGLVFLDEISTAPPATQAALLRPLTDRYVGDVRLPENTRFVLAANPPDQAADGWDLAAPLANRMVHLEWTLPASVVADGLANGFPAVEIPTVPAAAADKSVKDAMILVGGFLAARPDLVSVVPDSASDAGRAYPTPRSWEMAARLLGYARAAGASAIATQTLLIGAVGPGPAIEFSTWIDELDLPNPEDVLKNPKGFQVPDRPDHIHPIAASLLAAVTEEPTKARAAAMDAALVKMANAGYIDSVFAAASGLARLKVKGWVPSPEFVSAFVHLIAALGDLGKKAA